MTVRSLDKEKIRAKLDVIQSQRALLDDFIRMSIEDFCSGVPEFTLKYDACLYRLQVALQAVLDVSQYIVSCTTETSYKENKDLFGILYKEGILSLGLATKFTKAIGVRNILVHHYEEVDPEVIHGILQKDLGDFDRFVSEISDYLDKQ